MNRPIIKRGLPIAVCVVGALLVPQQVTAVSTKAMDLLQQGYAECKSAHLMRRKDLDGAKSAFEKYQNLKAQAAALDASLVNEEDPEAGRIISYCNTVGEDIGRTEALPVFTEGAGACAEAAELLQNSDLNGANKAYGRYLRAKDEAVAISSGILEVFSVSTEVRRCDRVGQDIAEAKARVDAINKQLAESKDYVKETLALCEKVAKPKVSVSKMDTEALKGMKQRLKDVAARTDKIPHSELLTEELPENAQARKEIAELSKQAAACRSSLQIALETRDKELLVLAEQARKQKEELAKKKAAQEQPETEEQRIARLSNNYEFYKLVKRVAPEFPRRALRGGSEGYVIIEYKINPKGEVFDAVVIESTPGKIFDDAALDAINKWKYKADFQEQKPDTAMARTRMQFSLSE